MYSSDYLERMKSRKKKGNFLVKLKNPYKNRFAKLSNIVLASVSLAKQTNSMIRKVFLLKSGLNGQKSR
jgi:hypothetical protein